MNTQTDTPKPKHLTFQPDRKYPGLLAKFHKGVERWAKTLPVGTTATQVGYFAYLVDLGDKKGGAK